MTVAREALSSPILACMATGSIGNDLTKPPKPSCGLAYNVRWTVGSEATFKGDKECW